ncbi:YccF domain-containing protein, partial [Methylocaldum sp.]
SIKLGFAVFAPFGKEVVELDGANNPLRIIFNLIWLLLFGWEIALAHLASAAVLAVTIIGIPFALQHIKLIPLSLFPFGRDFRPIQS